MANWVLFAAGAADVDVPSSALKGSRVTRYTVEACRAITGPAPSILAGPLVRIESAAPVELAGVPASHQFRGTAQHLNYTSTPQRADLEARSRTPLIDGAADPSDVICVMIPIAKSAAWWALSTDVRTGHFQRAAADGPAMSLAAHHQHTAIGAPYVERIYRKLYHSRYHGGPDSPIPYDFVTYFEFLEADRLAFDELLAGLRDTKLNPEWAYVTNEFEVWMRGAR